MYPACLWAAQQAREIFQLFRTHASLPCGQRASQTSLDQRVLDLEARYLAHGPSVLKGPLRRLLTNAAYAGKVKYRGTIYDGKHLPIIETEAWEAIKSASVGASRQGCGSSQAARSIGGAAVLQEL